jgi:putative Mn2+ efflux pump MntP
MKLLLKVFPAGHFVISALFVVSAILLMGFAVHDLWKLVGSAVDGAARVQGVLNAIALLTIAVATLELGQTIIEEEVQREAHMAAPTRVRRFLSRFMVVLVVALSIETLVAVFEFSRSEPSHLPYAAAIGIAAAALLAAWGLFIKLNRAAEELEPEAMEKAKEEDAVVEKANEGTGANKAPRPSSSNKR